MNNSYPKAYVEVLEILKYIPKEEQNKIPNQLIEVLKQNADKNYQYRLDTTQGFEKQNLLDETKAILAILFRDYWATDEERKQIVAKENLERRERYKELSQKYNPKDLFKTKEKTDLPKQEIIVYEKEKWYKKFLRFIKNFIKK